MDPACNASAFNLILFSFFNFLVSYLFFFPPQGPKPIWFWLFPVTLPNWWPTVCLQLQKCHHQAHLSHSRALCSCRRHRLTARPHPQRREPRSWSQFHGGLLREPHCNEDGARRGGVAQLWRDKHPVRVVPLAQPQLNWTWHSIAHWRRAARGPGGKEWHPHPAAVLQEEPAGRRQRLYRRRHRFHCQPQETPLQDLQETEEIRALRTPAIKAVWLYSSGLFFLESFFCVKWCWHKLFPLHLFESCIFSEKLNCGSN